MEQTKCEGNCIETHGEHKGEVSHVVVYSIDWKETKFNYCQNAVDEDTRRGFTVKKATE